MPVIVGFISQKGGVGKSTLARALGAVVAHAGLKVRIADLDAKHHTVVAWEEARHENQVAPTLQVRAFKSVSAAIATADPDELVILDAAAGESRHLGEIAARADLLVQPSSGGLDDLRPAVMLFHDLVQSGVPKERLVVALCRILSDGEEDAARRYIRKAGYDVLAGSIPERGGYREAQNRGQALTETNQKTLNDRAVDLMDALFRKVMAQLVKRDRAAKAGGRR